MIREEGKAGELSAKSGPPFWYPRPPPLTLVGMGGTITGTQSGQHVAASEMRLEYLVDHRVTRGISDTVQRPSCVHPCLDPTRELARRVAFLY